MANVSVAAIRELRERTGAGVMECRAALEETQGHLDQATALLRQRAIAEAEKRAGREATEGIVGSYLHHTAKLGVLVEVGCETDFVARTEAFKGLVKLLAEQIAATGPAVVDRSAIAPDVVAAKRRDFAEQARSLGKPEHLVEKIVTGKLEAYFRTVALLDQPWVREPDRTVGDLVKEASGRLGERLEVRRFARLALGEGVVDARG